MAENAPPAASAAAPSASGATTTNSTTGADSAPRGQPYYEKLRRDLRDAISRKRALDASLVQLEDSIFRMESAYLDDTPAGNIIKGFESYMKASATGGGALGGGGMGGGGGTATRKRGGVGEVDRIFSRSSAVTSRDSPLGTHSHTPSSTSRVGTPLSTPGIQTAATTPGASTGGNPKKHKKGASQVDEDEETGKKPAKRGKISYARE